MRDAMLRVEIEEPMGILLFLFILVPAVEVTILAQIVGAIGGLNTLLLVVVTGVVGAALAKRQGLGLLRQIQAETAAGRVPTGSLVDGAIILVAGALLVTPGILTDAVGFLCLFPQFRTVVKKQLRKRFERMVEQGQVQVHHPVMHDRREDEGDGRGPVIDVTPKREDQA